MINYQVLSSDVILLTALDPSRLLYLHFLLPNRKEKENEKKYFQNP